jgi:hypothetical protein
MATTLLPGDSSARMVRYTPVCTQQQQGCTFKATLSGVELATMDAVREGAGSVPVLSTPVAERAARGAQKACN